MNYPVLEALTPVIVCTIWHWWVCKYLKFKPATKNLRYHSRPRLYSLDIS